jgi:hypothetical protein
MKLGESTVDRNAAVQLDDLLEMLSNPWLAAQSK